VTEEWDFTHWPLLKDVLRFASSGGKVELLITTALAELPEKILHQLSALSAMPGNTLCIRPITESLLAQSKGRWLAQIVGDDHCLQWAAGIDAITIPGESWGQSATTPVVSCPVHVAKVLPGDALSPEELLPELPAGAVRINLSHQLDGPLDGFGSRFWALISSQHPFWKRAFTEKREIAQVQYSDRYVNSPFTARLLAELLTELVEQGMAERAALSISVKKLDYSSRQHDLLFNAWLNEQDREQVVRTLLEEGYLGPAWSGNISWFIGDNRTTDHGRELTVSFKDGSEGYLLLDMGLGYWRCQGDSFFDFEEHLSRQVEIVASSRANLIAPDNGLRSYIIVG
jgi:DEAD/DEAH box helicase domain-containing protein